MDTNKGATIIDIIHLETDQKVIDNFEEKKELQDITLGDIQAVLERTKSQEGIRYI